jgi:DNA-binding IclR family transcriptional regulator
MEDTATLSIERRALTQTLAKGLEVLEALSEHEAIGLSQLARELAVSGPTLFRLLSTLQTCGYVEKSAAGKYRLTLKTWELGAKAVRRIALRDVAQPYMERLVAQTDETVHLSVRQGDGIVIIDKRDCRQPVRVETHIGLRAPLHGSATGKAILAFLPAGAMAAALAAPLTRYTEATIVDRALFARELAEVRRSGWAKNREEWRPGVCAAAVPIFDAGGAVAAALSVTVPTSRFSATALRERIVPALKDTGALLSQALARTAA